MSNSNNFAGGFFLGAVVGGVLGGILGATLISQRVPGAASGSKPLDESDRNDRRGRDNKFKRVLSGATQPDFESTRQGLEDKIAQLNDAIDEARQQLGNSRVGTEDPDLHRSSDWDPSPSRIAEEF